MPFSGPHVHGVKWALDMLLLALQQSLSPTHSLLERETERSRLLYEQIASERLKRTQSTYTYPTSTSYIIVIHPSTVPTRRIVRVP